MDSTPAQSKRGTQSIYSLDGSYLHRGGWDSKYLYKAITGDNDKYWAGRKVLDIGANTSGLSVELARRGAKVHAIEPDPYQNTKTPEVLSILKDLIVNESLDLEISNHGLFDANELGSFDTILCLGLVYHFRDQQFVIDYLSTLDLKDLIISV